LRANIRLSRAAGVKDLRRVFTALVAHARITPKVTIRGFRIPFPALD